MHMSLSRGSIRSLWQRLRVWCIGLRFKEKEFALQEGAKTELEELVIISPHYRKVHFQIVTPLRRRDPRP